MASCDIGPWAMGERAVTRNRVTTDPGPWAREKGEGDLAPGSGLPSELRDESNDPRLLAPSRG